MSEPVLAATIGGLTIPDPVIAAFMGALTAGAFSILVFHLSRRKEERGRRREASLIHIQRQIEELYGPLVGYLETTDVIHKIVMQHLGRSGKEWDLKEFTEEERNLWFFLNESFFLPTNTKIAALLREKSYLIDEIDVPAAFQSFPAHALQYELVNTLWKHTGVDTSFIKREPFPADIKEAAETRLKILRENYRELISIKKGK